MFTQILLTPQYEVQYYRIFDRSNLTFVYSKRKCHYIENSNTSKIKIFIWKTFSQVNIFDYG